MTRSAGGQAVSSINEAGDHARFVQSRSRRPYASLRPAGEAGEVDILVNGAGASTIGSAVEMGLAVQHVFDMNVIAHSCSPVSLQPKWGLRGAGAIINVSSHAAGHGIPILPAHGAIEAGLDLSAKAWAVEFRSGGGARRMQRLPGPRKRSTTRTSSVA